jgi:MFS family permease
LLEIADMISDIYHRALRYLRRIRQLEANIHLVLLAGVLGGIGYSVFYVVFNLYILSMGIEEDVLGRIVGANPLAMAFAAIPAGFVAERIGFRKSMLVIYAVTGLTNLAQLATPEPALIMLAGFIGGLASSGTFVVRIPFFAANSRDEDRNLVYSVAGVLQSISMSAGAVFAGHVPNLLGTVTPDLTIAYRYTLAIASGLSLLALLPILRVREKAQIQRRAISLHPYLWGIDRTTVKHAVISLFRGLNMGLVRPFLNVYFVLHLGTSREFYSTVSALAVVPSTLANALSPLVASTLGTARTITLLRCLMSVPTIAITLTAIPVIAALFHWTERAISGMVMPLTFAFSMDTAQRRAKTATAAWMHVSFVLGQAIAAPTTGLLLAQSRYTLPFYLSAAAMAVAGVLNYAFFRALHTREDPSQTKG